MTLSADRAANKFWPKIRRVIQLRSFNPPKIMPSLTELAPFTENVVAMAAFYRQLLGADPVAQSDGMAIFMVGQTKIFIHKTYSPKDDELPPENHWAFSVPDVDLACAELQAKGISIEIEPHDYYWGRSAYLRDPDRHLLELNQTSE
jgi:catechol 2,3-dioxygenase-like lactoylglutathione lyase family enzyme